MDKITNFAFGKVANRSVVRVFLPRMCSLHETRAIPAQDLELIYNECLRPLVRRFMPNMYTHWPVSYASAMTLYHDQMGRIHEGSLDVPSELLLHFGTAYLDRLSTLKPYFSDAYFVHEFHGWKGATVHDAFNQEDMKAAFHKISDVLDMTLIDQSQWHVDIGLEFGTHDHVVTWSNAGHYTLLSHCLPSLPLNQVEGLIHRKAEIDHMMHLQDLTGFRCTPGAKGRNDSVSYVQAYTTEKAMTYQLHTGLFSALEPRSMLSKTNLKDLLGKIEGMSAVLYDCTADGEEHDRTQEGSARVEIRVQLSKALTSFIQSPQKVLDDCLVAIPAKYW